jgi:tetratricopeptide (TPR) repeat protein
MNNQFERARLLYQQQRYNLALREVTEVLSVEPNHDEAHVLRGLCLTLTNNHQDGLAAIQMAISINPESSYAHDCLAYIYKILGDLVAAKNAVDRAIALNPTNTSCRLRIAYIVDSLLYLDKHQIAALLPALNLGIDLSLTPELQFQALCKVINFMVDKILELDPVNVSAFYLRLNTFYELKSFEELELGCYELLNIDPNHAFTYNMLGLVSQQRKCWIESIKFFRKALMIDPNFDIARCNLNISYLETAKGYTLPSSISRQLELVRLLEKQKNLPGKGSLRMLMGTSGQSDIARYKHLTNKSFPVRYFLNLNDICPYNC